MFVHVAKDFMKKLDDLETRLSVSLDKDEIHTLGLKLRFYYNEIRHYQTLMREIHDRIITIQKKFGFKPEEIGVGTADIPAAPPRQPTPQQGQPLSSQPQPSPQPPLPAAPQGEGQDVIKLLADWVMKLQKQGHSPQQALAMARDYIRNNAAPGSLDISLPGETPFALPQPESASPGTPLNLSTENTPVPPAAQSPEPEIETQEIEPAPETMPDSGLEPAGPPDQAHPSEPEDRTEDALDQDLENVADSTGDQALQQEPAEQDLCLMDLLASWSLEITDSELPPGLADRINGLLTSRRAEIHMQLEDMAEALKPDGNGVPASGFSLFCLGLFAWRLGREGLAITLLDKSISEGAAFPLSFLALGHCYQAKRISEKALINFKFANKLDPAIEEARLGIAKAQLALNRFEDALDYLAEQNFDVEENQVDSILLQSHALEKLGRLPVAVDLLEQTVQTCRSVPCTAACLFRLGRIKEQQNDILKAIDLYEETVESDPEHLEARFNLGRLYLQHKAIPLARKHLFYLTRNHPESPWADRAREIV